MNNFITADTVANIVIALLLGGLEMANEAIKQESKMGHWVKGTPKYKFNLLGDTVEVANYECSECGRIIRDIDCVGNQALLKKLSDFPYCRHCGCRMAESQESEVTE